MISEDNLIPGRFGRASRRKSGRKICQFTIVSNMFLLYDFFVLSLSIYFRCSDKVNDGHMGHVAE